jgi:flagellar basal-body rod protein FlgF
MLERADIAYLAPPLHLFPQTPSRKPLRSLARTALAQAERCKMSQGIYVGMTGASARAEQLDVIADNLANAQTPGFKAQKVAFYSFLPPENAEGDKVYAASADAGLDLRPGPVERTDNPLDIMPQNGAYLGVVRSDGSISYTRNGRVQVDAEGTLVVGGLPLAGDGGGPILVPPNTRPEITFDGKVRVNGVEVGRVALFDIPGSLVRVGPSMFDAADPEGVASVQGQVRIGELEMSNFSSLDAMVEMVSVQRSFDHSMQALETYQELDRRAIDVGRVRG